MEKGKQIGQYTLVRYLGKGGMAEVWEARHSYLANKGRLAIKFLLPQFATNKELQERFLKEAQRQLEHPNIISALDFFQIDGLSYMVMRYVPPPSPDNAPESLEEMPRSLEDRLAEQRPLSLKEIHVISSDVLSALDYAHGQGVVHRDVKPANILLHRNGHAMLTDFGIAKGLRDERSMTRIGTSMGTPDYMSPEQIREPHKVDARSDVYSFGCVLYAMLSRNPPFGTEEDTTEFDIKDRHVRVAPPPIVYWNKAIPASVGDVAFTCLEKDPARRFQCCDDVKAALDEAILPKEIPPVVLPETAAGKGAVYKPTEVDTPDFTQPPRTSTTPIRVPAAPVPTTPVPTPAPIQIPPPVPPASHTPVPKHPEPMLPPVSVPAAPVPAPPSRSRVYLIAGLVFILVAIGAGVAKFYRPLPENEPVVQWETLPIGSTELNDCKGIAACTARKNLGSQLMAADWKSIRYDSPLLRDCMSYQPCLDRKAHADAMQGQNWSTANAATLDDCMQFSPCVQERLRRMKSSAAVVPVKARTPTAVDPESLPSCCRDAPNPALCKQQKKAAGIHGDCVLGH